MIDTTSPIETYQGGRFYSAMTAEGNKLAGQIDAVLMDDPKKDYSPSQLARKVKANTTDVAAVLSFLDRKGLIVRGNGNGAWRRYSAR